jgi:TonB-dependent receptor
MLMRILSSIKRILSLVLFVPMIAFGQASLKGTVTDAVSNETLIGTNVIVQGTSLGAATDIEGQYRIAGIPERVLNIKISCVGYEVQIIEIDFSKTKDVQKNIQMKPQVIQGEEVVVTAQMRGQLAAINQQITSKTIMNVVSEEKIQELPDANAAEAIGRLPGVSLIRSGGEASQVVLRGLSSKFSNITVDGVKIPATDPNSRDVDLSMLSQGALAGIELHKTLTADQDADAIAGAINLVTRKAPLERLLRFDLKGDYNNLMESAKQYDFSARYGERFFNDILGVQVQGNAERKIRSREDISNHYTISTNPTLANPFPDKPANIYGNAYQLDDTTRTFTDELRKRNGGQVIFDANTPDSGSVKLSGLYSETNKNTMMYSRSLPNGYGGPDFDYQYMEQKISTSNASLQGVNYLLGLTVDWNLAYAESKITNPAGFRASFQAGAASVDDYATGDYSTVVLDSSKIIHQENLDKEQTFQLNISRKFVLGDVFADEFKMGGKYKNKSRWMQNSGYNWNNYRAFASFANPDGTPISYAGTRFAGVTTTSPSLSYFLDNPLSSRRLIGLYTLKPIISEDGFKQWYVLNKNAAYTSLPDFGPDALAVLSDYDVTEQVSSGYFMNTLDMGQSMTLILGVRVEKESNSYGAKNSDRSVGGTGSVSLIPIGAKIIDTTANYMETIWLPSAQMSIKVTDYLTLRFAAYRALARPDFALRLPQFAYSSSSNKFIVGNPNLKDAKAWNYEVNTQVFNNIIGLFSVSAYYKVIDDLFHQTNDIRISWPAGGPNAPIGNNGWTTNEIAGLTHRLDVLLNQLNMSSWKKNAIFADIVNSNYVYDANLAYNSPNPSYAWGIEIEHQINFGFLPISWLQNVTLSYNLSFTRSKTDILVGTEVIDTTWTPPHGTGSHTVPGKINLLQNGVAVWQTHQSEDQPTFFMNAALGYDFKGLSVRVSVFHQDRYTRQYSAAGTSDAIVDPFTKWDLAVKQQISSKISLFANVNNIFNKKESTSRYNNLFSWGYLPRTEELYGTSVDFGARVSL